MAPAQTAVLSPEMPSRDENASPRQGTGSGAPERSTRIMTPAMSPRSRIARANVVSAVPWGQLFRPPGRGRLGRGSREMGPRRKYEHRHGSRVLRETAQTSSRAFRHQRRRCARSGGCGSVSHGAGLRLWLGDGRDARVVAFGLRACAHRRGSLGTPGNLLAPSRLAIHHIFAEAEMAVGAGTVGPRMQPTAGLPLTPPSTPAP